MGEHAGQPYLHGRVTNKSRVNVWVLFDQGGVVYARILQPGRKSPLGLDVDAVGGYNEGDTIDGWAGWWKVPGIVTATVRNNTFSSGISVYGNPPGILRRTNETDWGTPGGNIEYSYLPNWGENA